MQALIFDEFGLKMPVYAPNGGFLGIWPIVEIVWPIFAQLTLLPSPLKSYALQSARHSPRSAHFCWGICTSIWCMVPWVHPTQLPKQQFDQFSRVCRAPAERPYTLPLSPLSPQIAYYHGESGPPSNIYFLGSTQVCNPNGILIGSAIFADLMTVTDRQTDRPCYSSCNNRPHLHM